MWVTSTATPDTAPNDAFINDETTVSDKVLDSRTISISSPAAVLSFRNNFNTEHDPRPPRCSLGWRSAGGFLAHHKWRSLHRYY